MDDRRHPQSHEPRVGGIGPALWKRVPESRGKAAGGDGTGCSGNLTPLLRKWEVGSDSSMWKDLGIIRSQRVQQLMKEVT